MTDQFQEDSNSLFTPQNSGPTYQAYIIHAYEHRAYPLLDEESFWIGRSSDSDIVVREVFVSRKHAEIRPEGIGYTIYPVGSTQTLLNGIQITSHQALNHGDVINIGSMKFTFSQNKLPVAMQIADPWTKASRLYDEVNDRRPTLSFPIQRADTMERQTPKVPMWVWIILLILIALVVSGLVYWDFLKVS